MIMSIIANWSQLKLLRLQVRVIECQNKIVNDEMPTRSKKRPCRIVGSKTLK
jgi:hypothetical protein